MVAAVRTVLKVVELRSSSPRVRMDSGRKRFYTLFKEHRSTVRDRVANCCLMHKETYMERLSTVDLAVVFRKDAVLSSNSLRRRVAPGPKTSYIPSQEGAMGGYRAARCP